MDDVVYFARHGQTEWNVQKRRQGQLDSPLTTAGRNDAEQMATRLQDVGIDALYTSPLGRARETAGVLAEALAVDVEVLPDLAEVHHGAFAGLRDSEIQERFGDVWADRLANLYDWRFPDGESYRDADMRAHAALTAIRGSAARRPLVVSHEMIGRMLIGRALGLSSDRALALSHPHGIIHVVERGESLRSI